MDIGTSIMQKLGIGQSELNSLYVACPVDGFIGTAVAAELVAKFKLDSWLPMGSQLETIGILSAEEADWFDDAD